MKNQQEILTHILGDKSVEDHFVVRAGQHHAIVTINNSPVDVNYGYPNSYSTYQRIAGVDAVRWGKDNRKPTQMLKLVAGNHVKPQLLKTERDFLLGSRNGFFEELYEPDLKTGGRKRRVEPIEIPELDDWAEMVDVRTLMQKVSYNYVYCHNYFINGSLDKNKKVDALECFDFDLVRAEQMKFGRINNYFIHPYWDTPKADDVTTVPAFDRRNPTKFGEFMYHGRDWTPGQPYYDWAPWWGSENWTKVSNLIPAFHESGLLNGYNIKYHIKIPSIYFAQFGDEDQQKAQRKKLKQDMDSFLAGKDNVDKAFTSEFAIDDMGKPLPGFEIIPLQNFMSDEAYMKLDTNANINQASSHGINPTLANIDTGGKLGGSGLEAKVNYQLHIAIHTPNDRDIITSWFHKMVLPIMGWNKQYNKKIILGFEDIDVSVADANSNPNKPADINNKMG